MLGNKAYYFAAIRKSVIAFANLFSDIEIDRFDNSGNKIQTIKVPLTFDKKEKWYYRVTQDPNSGLDGAMPVQVILPRMSYEFSSLQYDSQRKTTSTQQTFGMVTDSNKTLYGQHDPVPYDIGFELNIFTKNMDDSLAILEQILPFFKPTFTVNIKEIPEIGLIRDMPVTLTSVSHDDSWDGSFTDRRMLSWTLSFIASIYLHPPLREVPIITSSIQHFDVGEQTILIQTVEVDPPTAKADNFNIKTTTTEL